MHYVEVADVTLSHHGPGLYITAHTKEPSDVFNRVLHNITDALHELSSFYLVIHFKSGLTTMDGKPFTTASPPFDSPQTQLMIAKPLIQ